MLIFAMINILMDNHRPNNFEELNYTSDHVPRDIEVKISNETWKGFTWNLQEWCHGCSEESYSNNPFDFTETSFQYETRKIKQINEMMIMCKEKDFGALQKVDFCSTVSNDSLDTIRDYFCKCLFTIGWNFITYSEKQLVIIYKTSELSHISNEIFLPYKFKTQTYYSLFLATFKDKNGNIIKLGSMHGHYNTDYSNSVPKLLKILEANSYCTIIGGDMNHPPSYKIPRFLVSNDNEITNFTTNYSSVDGQYATVELNDTRCNNPKAYDGFFVTKGNAKVTGSYKWEKIIAKTGEEYPILTPI